MADMKLINHVDAFYRIEGFKAANIDAPGGVNYYGFISLSGHYYIMRETITGATTVYEYYARISDPIGVYATDWTGRAALTYTRYDSAFTKLA